MKFNLSRFEWSNKAVEKLAFRHGTLSTIDSSYISIWVYIDLISSTNNDSPIFFVMEFRSFFHSCFHSTRYDTSTRSEKWDPWRIESFYTIYTSFTSLTSVASFHTSKTHASKSMVYFRQRTMNQLWDYIYNNQTESTVYEYMLVSIRIL